MSSALHDSDLTIRNAGAADHAAIKAMNDGIQQAELEIVGYPMLTPDRLPQSYLEDMLAADPQRQGELLVCEAEGRVVGFLRGLGAADDDCLVEAEFNSFAIVSDLFVEPAFRSRGVAQAGARRKNVEGNWRTCRYDGSRRARPGPCGALREVPLQSGGGGQRKLRADTGR